LSNNSWFNSANSVVLIAEIVKSTSTASREHHHDLLSSRPSIDVRLQINLLFTVTTSPLLLPMNLSAVALSLKNIQRDCCLLFFFFLRLCSKFSQPPTAS
jgi:hypothetical protein